MGQAQSIVGDRKEGRPEFDFYPTPAIATLKLMNVEIFPICIWECACGKGNISDVLKNHLHVVTSTDIVNYGYPDQVVTQDFLKFDVLPYDECAIITNPPFNSLEEFIEKAVSLRPKKFAFLAKLATLEGVRRSKILDSTPLKNVWVFRKRLTMTRNGEPSRNGGMIAFAWFVWDLSYHGRPMIGWI